MDCGELFKTFVIIFRLYRDLCEYDFLFRNGAICSRSIANLTLTTSEMANKKENKKELIMALLPLMQNICDILIQPVRDNNDLTITVQSNTLIVLIPGTGPGFSPLVSEIPNCLGAISLLIKKLSECIVYKRPFYYSIALGLKGALDRHGVRKYLDEDMLSHNDVHNTRPVLSYESERAGPVHDPNTKRGLLGFVNGYQVPALADTGASQNVISASFAKEKGLVIELSHQPIVFKLGNSTFTHSLGKRDVFTRRIKH